MTTEPFPDPSKYPADYLEDALAAAEDELHRTFSRADFQVLAHMATDLVALRVGVVASGPKHPPYDGMISIFAPGVDVHRLRENALKLPADTAKWPPWIRYAVEFILLERAVDRLQDCRSRYSDLRALVVNRRIPQKIEDFLEEVVDLYIWGFDRASIAMACSCFERIARNALVVLEHATEPQLQRERPAAAELRNRLRQAGLLERSSQAADFLVTQRNAVLHDGLEQHKSLDETSRRCVVALLEVAEELHPSWPSGE